MREASGGNPVAFLEAIAAQRTAEAVVQHYE
jgi:hypothetical protein